MKQFPLRAVNNSGGVRVATHKPATNKGATADSGLSSGCKTVVSLANVLHPLDTCHGKEQVRAMDTSPVGALSEQGSAPPFRAQLGALVADWRFWLALMGLVIVVGYLTGNRVDEFYNGLPVSN